jgi:hypothetical protein
MFVPRVHLPDAHDPCKNPGWRWQRCGYLLDHGRQPLRQDDDAAREAWLFRRALESRHTDADRAQLAKDYPGLAEAHGVYTGEPLKRFELEARLLGGDSDEAIAAKCAISASCVEAYHATFYEVRPHLHADTYVVTVLIGSKAHHGLTSADHEPLLTLFGYAYGGVGVDTLLDFLTNPPAMPETFEDLDLPALKKLRRKLRVKLMVLLLTTPASAARPATWQQLGEQFAAARRASQNSDEGAVLASTYGLLDVITGLSMGGQPKAAEAVA